jgi:hypothetical protein
MTEKAIGFMLLFSVVLTSAAGLVISNWCPDR